MQINTNHTGLQPQSIQTLFNISDEGGKHWFSPAAKEAIWDQVETKFFPGFTSTIIWNFIFGQYYTPEDSTVTSSDDPADEFWATHFNFLLLILASEGETIA